MISLTAELSKLVLAATWMRGRRVLRVVEQPLGDDVAQVIADAVLASDWLAAREAAAAKAAGERIAQAILDRCDALAVQPCRACRHAATVAREVTK